MKARRGLQWLLFVVTLASAAGIAFGAYTLAGFSWGQVVDYESPYLDPMKAVTSTAGVPVADRVVMVIVDGMTAVITTEMNSLAAMKEYGASLRVRGGQPSLSYPGWTTLLSGAPIEVHGVTTNWHEGRVGVDTLLDTAYRDGRDVVIVGPTDIKDLYDASGARATYFKDWPKDGYLTAEFVDQVIALSESTEPQFVLLHLPDLDEAGHGYGADSKRYREVAGQIDADLARLVTALGDDRTAFVIVSDHGHIATGGHGGWEPEAVMTDAVIVGQGVALYDGEADQIDIAPTVALLAGLPAPKSALGTPVAAALATVPTGTLDPLLEHRVDAALVYYDVATGSSRQEAMALLDSLSSEAVDPAAELIEAARAERLARDRADRLLIAVALAGAAIVLIILLAAVSWRALLSAVVGMGVYYSVYNGLFFAVHGYQWSLSAFNSEDLIEAFFNGRMIEAAVAGVAAALVAGVVYPLLRRMPKGPRQGFTGGWLALGPATILVIQSTLAIQVAWYVWQWGADVVWLLPDLKWGFKYDLDLIQATALGGAALLSPLVTLLVGLYHPRVRRAGENGDGPRRRSHGDAPAPMHSKPLAPVGPQADAADVDTYRPN